MHDRQPHPSTGSLPGLSTDEPLRWDGTAPTDVDFLAIGGGFAGLMTALRVHEAMPNARIAVIERRPLAAPGVAYGSCHSTHLLNVPAERMGARAERPAEFLEWLRGKTDGAVAGSAFVPRAAFGRYLNELFRERLGGGANVELIRDDVLGVATHPDGSVSVTLASGARIRARTAVLAIGLPAAGAPWEDRTEFVAPGALVADPWEPGALEAPRDASVLIVGSGLTAIDAVLGLRRNGHRGSITLVSRYGRLPCPHASAGEPPFAFDEPLPGLPAARILGLVRRGIRARARAGLGWHAVIDAIRPHTVAIWQSWSRRERERFLARLRPFWEVHRHRAPVDVLSEISALQAAGTLELVRGDLALAVGEPDGRVRVTVETLDGAVRTTRAITVRRLINCCGPAMDLARSKDALIRALLARGVATVDAHGLGLRADARARLLPRSAAPANLYLVGALRRGDLWESTAIPELRGQAAAVAADIVSVLQAPAAVSAASPATTSAKEPPKRLPRRDATASPPAALLPLFAKLDAYDGPIPYERLVEIMQEHPVTAADLGDTIQVDGGAYVRTLVFEREHIEVLVMAWLPGQRSPIHDHAGSGCAVRVVAGTAYERLYAKDDDGFVVPTGDRVLQPGGVTGAFDDEIHSLGNATAAPPSSILVTIHAYSPPLRPTRKYEERPAGDLSVAGRR